MEEKLAIDITRLFNVISNHKDFNESELLEVLVDGLKGTLKVINANLWKINSFKNTAIKKKGNNEEYVTLLGCYGYVPDQNNSKEFIHDLKEGILGHVLRFDTPYEEISLRQKNYQKLHLAPERINKYNLTHLIIIPISHKYTAGYELRYVLNLYVEPYDEALKVTLKNHIDSLKKIFQFALENKKRILTAELMTITMDQFEKSRKEKHKKTDKILRSLFRELKNFIKFDACSIFMWDPIYHQLVLKQSSADALLSNPSLTDVSKDLSYYPGVGKTGKVYETGNPLIIDDINYSSEKDKFCFREKTTNELKSFMAIPIINPAQPNEKVGVIRLVNRLNQYDSRIVDYFSFDDVELVKTFGSVLALHLEVEQNEKVRTAFAKHMEHEIEGPIISTRNDAIRILDRKQEGKLENWQLIGNLTRIFENTALLLSIIKNVRYTWKESEGVPRSELYSVRESVDFLKEILIPAKNLVIPLLRDAGFGPDSIRIKGEDFKLCVDKDAFIQVFVNLYSNAIKYRGTDNSSELIEVTCTHDMNGETIIKVTDYGKGVAKENTEHIFRFGYREKNALATNIRGLGIGLSVVKKIIEDFYSRINIKSNRNPTTFEIILSTKLNNIIYINEDAWKKKDWKED